MVLNNLAVYKKLLSLGKKAGFSIVRDWAKSISNHLYWCASSSGGDAEMVQEKWKSVTNHVVNIHDGHSSKFPACEHDVLEDRAWIVQGISYLNGI